MSCESTELSQIEMQSKASGNFNSATFLVDPEAKVIRLTQTWSGCVTVELQPVLAPDFFLHFGFL